MKLIRKLFCLFLLFTLAGCNKIDNTIEREKKGFIQPSEIYTEFVTKYNGKIKEFDVTSSDNYYTFGLWSKNSESMHDCTIKLSQNTLETFLVFENYLGKQYNFTLVIFDNYEQIDFVVDGKQMRQCTVNIANQSKVEIPITISSLENGKHDLVFAVIIDTYRELTDEERMHTGDLDGALRCIAIVGNDNNFTRDFNYIDIDEREARTNGVVINQDNNKNYYIEIGNLGERKETCAIIFLDNFEQIDLLNSEHYPSDLVELSAGNEIIISLNEYVKKTQKDKMAHELIVICINQAGVGEENYGGRVFSQIEF